MITRFDLCLLLGILCQSLYAAAPVVEAKDQAALLQSSDPKLAANKRLAYDYYRTVIRGRHLDQIEKYMREDCLQHNPNADGGTQGVKAYFSKLGGPLAIPERLPGLVAVQAEGDYVTMSFVREADDPANNGQKYTTTWFEMYRIEKGKIAEHWDPATKPSASARNR